MSTSLLYHGFGLRGYRYTNAIYEKGCVTFEIEPLRLRCPCCHYRDVIRRGNHRRVWQSVPIGDHPVFFAMECPRIECRACGALQQIKLGFADPYVGYTRAFARYVLGLCRCMTMQDAARHLSVGWGVVKQIVKRDLQKRFAKPGLKDTKRLAIDEIAVKKGHKYLTVVLDLDTGAVVFVGNGKGADALRPFWKRLKRSKATIRAVACDLSPAYTAAVMGHLPRAKLVFDRFHVVKLMNDKLSKLRRDLQREADTLGKKLLKGTRWLLLKNPENLDDARHERSRLEEVLKFNRPLAEAYWMKEQLRQFWNQPSRKAAQGFLERWCDWAWDSGIKVLIQMATTLATHKTGLLNWYSEPISTGPLEGVNNKIKTMKRQAYGYRDREFFKLKIMALHETKFKLVG